MGWPLLPLLGSRDRFGGSAGGFSSTTVRLEIAPLSDVELEENVAVVEDEDRDGVPLPYAEG